MLIALALSLQLSAAPGSGFLSGSERCGSCLLAQAPERTREAELTREIDLLNSRIRSVSTDWPVGSLIASYFGYGLSPFFLIGALLVPAGLMAGGSMAGPLLAIGIITAGVGVLGVALLVVGIMTGLSASNQAKAEKAQLVQERERLEAELREVKRGQQRSHAPEPAPAWITVAAF